jgi:hypothetical protein
MMQTASAADADGGRPATARPIRPSFREQITLALLVAGCDSEDRSSPDG